MVERPKGLVRVPTIGAYPPSWPPAQRGADKPADGSALQLSKALSQPPHAPRNPNPGPHLQQGSLDTMGAARFALAALLAVLLAFCWLAAARELEEGAAGSAEAPAGRSLLSEVPTAPAAGEQRRLGGIRPPTLRPCLASATGYGKACTTGSAATAVANLELPRRSPLPPHAGAAGPATPGALTGGQMGAFGLSGLWSSFVLLLLFWIPISLVFCCTICMR